MKTPRKKNLVIGLGSLLSRDDAFGPLVLDRIARTEQGRLQDTDLLGADTDLMGWVEEFTKHSRLILVDAVLDPEGQFGAPGDVVVLEEESFTALPESSPGAHQISPLTAIKLFRTLYPEARTQITLVACCTDRISFRTSDDDALADHIVEAGVRAVLSLL